MDGGHCVHASTFSIQNPFSYYLVLLLSLSLFLRTCCCHTRTDALVMCRKLSKCFIWDFFYFYIVRSIVPLHFDSFISTGFYKCDQGFFPLNLIGKYEKIHFFCRSNAVLYACLYHCQYASKMIDRNLNKNTYEQDEFYLQTG